MAKAKLSLESARSLALEIIEILKPACERIEIAGSIRREKSVVGDIELVCISRKLVLENLFSEPVNAGDAIGAWVMGKAPLLKWKIVAGGDRQKKIDVGPCMLDLFITTPEKWGVIFALRTGDKDFSHRLVKIRRYGGYLPSDSKIDDGRVIRKGKLIETPEEIDFFNFIGEWVDPRERTGNYEFFRTVGAGREDH